MFQTVSLWFTKLRSWANRLFAESTIKKKMIEKRNQMGFQTAELNLIFKGLQIKRMHIFAMKNKAFNGSSECLHDNFSSLVFNPWFVFDHQIGFFIWLWQLREEKVLRFSPQEFHSANFIFIFPYSSTFKGRALLSHLGLTEGSLAT